jgi:molybdopterin-guanine dinucleotide biosynthesis protein A
VSRNQSPGTSVQDIGAAILAGGESTRFGSPKAFVPIGGEPLVVRTLRTLRDMFSSVVISTNDPDPYFPLGARMIGDVLPSRGPLAGIHAALMNCPADAIFVCACDMPFIDPKIIALICDRHRQSSGSDATIPVFEGAPQPLFGVYCKTTLGLLEQAVREDKVALKRFLAEVRTTYVGEPDIRSLDPLGRTFMNINTPADLELLQERPCG